MEVAITDQQLGAGGDLVSRRAIPPAAAAAPFITQGNTETTHPIAGGTIDPSIYAPGAHAIDSTNPNGPVYTAPGLAGKNPSFQVGGGIFTFDPNSGSGDQQGHGATLDAAIADARAVDPVGSFIQETPAYVQPAAPAGSVPVPSPALAAGAIDWNALFTNSDYLGQYAGQKFGGTNGQWTTDGLPGFFTASLNPNSGTGWDFAYTNNGQTSTGGTLVSALAGWVPGAKMPASGTPAPTGAAASPTTTSPAPLTLSSVADTTQTSDPGSGVATGLGNPQLLTALTNALGGTGNVSADGGYGGGVGTPSTAGLQAIAPTAAATTSASNPIIPIVVVGVAAIGGFMAWKHFHHGKAPAAAAA